MDIPGWNPTYLAVFLTIFLSSLAWQLYRFVKSRKNVPKLDSSSIIYREFFASGHSSSGTWSSKGMAKNCLVITITADELRINSWFPFSLLDEHFDLAHIISKSSISTVVRKRRRLTECFEVTGLRPNGREVKLSLYPKNQDRFVQCLGLPVTTNPK
ncbi:MAG: hypothetical protein ABL962_11375 [Fimbriimonadaceae bacterium]